QTDDERRQARTAGKASRIKGEFLKGPIPLSWLTPASRLRGKAPLAVAMAIWFESGRRRSLEVRLTSAILRRFSVSRKTKYRALDALSKAGLIRVQREPRRNPVVTIVEAADKLNAEGDSDPCPRSIEQRDEGALRVARDIEQ